MQRIFFLSFGARFRIEVSLMLLYVIQLLDSKSDHILAREHDVNVTIGRSPSFIEIGSIHARCCTMENDRCADCDLISLQDVRWALQAAAAKKSPSIWRPEHKEWDVGSLNGGDAVMYLPANSSAGYSR